MRYRADVTREGHWWMVHVPEVDGLTQTRRLTDVAAMTAELITVTTGTRTEASDVDVRIADINGVNIGSAVDEIRQERAARDAIEQRLAETTTHVARSLADADVPLRDIGELLGVSFQRAHQLLGTRS